MNKCCIKCSVKLVPGKNIHDFCIKNSWYICISCHHYKQNGSRMYVNNKYISRNHPLHKPGRYKSFNDAAFSSFKNLVSTKAGHVYIISNPAWPEWVKVGMAIDTDDRCSSYQTSSPFRDYVVEYSFASTNRRRDESLAHQKLDAICPDRRGEWFKLPVSEAIGCISGITK